MNLIRRSTWVVVMLGAAVGCSSEEGTSAPGGSPTPSPSMAPKAPVVPSSPKGEAAKEGASKEMTPPPAKAEGAKKSDEAKTGDGSPKLEGPKTEAGKGDAAAVKLDADEIAAIKELPAGEQAAALQQAVCPVSDGHLGAMGKPQKITVEGKTVYLCCEECEKEIKANPKKYLAKLEAESKKK